MVDPTLAKDTEKLIRQLSLIAYLMAERRPVTAGEIRRDVEGYSDMTEDAFGAASTRIAPSSSRSLYPAPRSTSRRRASPSRRTTRSRREAFHLPPIAFTDNERSRRCTLVPVAARRPVRLRRAAAAGAAADHLGPARSPLGSDSRQTIGLGITASAGGGEVSARLAKIDTAIYRRKRIEFEYHTMGRDETALRRGRPVPPAVRGRAVLPRRLLARAQGRARLPALADPRGRSRTRARPSTTSSAPRTSTRGSTPGGIPWQLGDPVGVAELEIPENLEWYIERQYGDYGTLSGGVFRTEYSIARLLISWALEFGLRIVGPPELVDDARSPRGHADRGPSRRAEASPIAESSTPGGRRAHVETNGRSRGGEAGTPPERFARLVTLASVLIAAGRGGERLQVADVCEQLKMSAAGAARGRLGAQRRQLRRRRLRDLRRDPAVGRDRGRPGAVLGHVRPPRAAAADRGQGAGRRDRPDRPRPRRTCAPRARRSSTRSASTRSRRACRSSRPRRTTTITHTVELAVAREPAARARVLDADRGPLLRARASSRTRCFNGARGAGTSPPGTSERGQLRHFRLDRIKSADGARRALRAAARTSNPIADIGGWPRTGTVGGSRVARVLDLAPSRRAGRASSGPCWPSSPDGADRRRDHLQGHRASSSREVLKEAGDAVVLEPADAREAVLAAAEGLIARATT